MDNQLATFFQKRWVRVVGILPLTIYSLLAYISIDIVLNQTIYRSPNHVFPITDGPGWLGYFFFLSIIFSSGIIALITAYFMKGLYRILYIAGLLAMVSSVSYLPLSIEYNAEYVENAKKPEMSFWIDIWTDGSTKLELNKDNTFKLYNARYLYGDSDIDDYKGTWIIESNSIKLTSSNEEDEERWRLLKSDGYYFIRYENPDNPDAWSGNLGLMRSQKWLDTH